MTGPSSVARKALEKATAAAGRAVLPEEGEFYVGPLKSRLQYPGAPPAPTCSCMLLTLLHPCPQYYKNFAAFKEKVDGFRGRLQQLLTSLPVRRRRRRPPGHLAACHRGGSSKLVCLRCLRHAHLQIHPTASAGRGGGAAQRGV